jgi:anthranilate synthase/aminodeoxychorismate synthase-like glutamine amidotransferase
MTSILIVDNYDSFTYNLADGLRRAGAKVTVHRNDAISRAEIEELAPDGIVLSPGPGHPGSERDFGICRQLIEEPRATPMLGVCLGMQGMALFTGGLVGRAPTVVHGEAAEVSLGDHPLFTGVTKPTRVGRYHSLCVADPGTQWTPLGHAQDGTLMAMQHKKLPWVGVQFHPESILTPEGQLMLEHFVAMCS